MEGVALSGYTIPMEKLIVNRNQITKNPWVPRVISALAAAVYTTRIWIYAHSQDSILDDGLYMLKGYLFTTGKYRPFQPFGPWTNKMPFSFLIPGYFQKLFGPGLRVGRYYAIGISLLFLIGAWLAARHLGGSWGAAAAVIIIALNPAPLKLYAMVFSEGLIAAMLVWMLAMVLGDDRPTWQLLPGAFIAGFIPVTRINMAPVLPFTLAYIFWEHGTRKGWYSTGISLVPLVGTHVLYWPEILKLSVKWIPESLTPFLDRFRIDFTGAIDVHDPVRSFKERYMSFLEGLRYHFPAIWGVVAGWILWPEKWEDRARFRAAVYLSALFSILLIMHGYASLFKDFNVFAFSIYLSFFEILGILFLVNTFPEWRKRQPSWKLYLIALLILAVSLGVFYSYAGTQTVFGKQIGLLLSKNSLQFQNGRILRAPWRIWETFKGTLGWNYRTSVFVFSIISLLVVEVVLLGIFVWLMKLSGKYKGVDSMAYGLLVGFLGLGILLSPTRILGGEMHNFSCRPGVIAEHERAADTLVHNIKNGDRVVWIGSNTQSVLLEIMASKNISLYPQQLNAQYSYRLGGDSTYLARHGYWNDKLERNWLAEADVILIERQAVEGWHGPLDPDGELVDYDQVVQTQTIGCFGNKQITLYRRAP